jgi:uncharacterized membrane protein (UPF0127 family)
MLTINKKRIGKKIFLMRSPSEINTGLRFQTIDVLFIVDETIVAIKQDLKPFRFHKPKEEFKHMAELPEGTIKKYGIKVGQKAHLDPSDIIKG